MKNFKVNSAGLGNMLSLQKEQIEKLVKLGALKSSPDNTFDLQESIGSYLSWLGQQGDERKLKRELDAARARIHSAAALRHELFADTLGGRALFLRDILRNWEEQVIVMKGRALSLPSTLPLRLMGMDMPELEKKLMRAFEDAAQLLEPFKIENYMRRGADYFFDNGNGHELPRVKARRSFIKKKLT